jgi:hypothetical protein
MNELSASELADLVGVTGAEVERLVELGVLVARRRVQGAVDRRFNRRRDTAQTMAAFSSRLRQQVDLDTLTAELLAVIDQTMQPTRASLWLRLKPATGEGSTRSGTALSGRRELPADAPSATPVRRDPTGAGDDLGAWRR